MAETECPYCEAVIPDKILRRRIENGWEINEAVNRLPRAKNNMGCPSLFKIWCLLSEEFCRHNDSHLLCPTYKEEFNDS